LDERDEELSFLREQGGDGLREEESLKRIEEDDAKIAALEIMLRDVDDSKESKEKLVRVEISLNEVRQRRDQLEERCFELARERDEALDMLCEARQEVGLTGELEERDDDHLEEGYFIIVSFISCLKADALGPASHSKYAKHQIPTI
jgi:myosin protein heavy chain